MEQISSPFKRFTAAQQPLTVASFTEEVNTRFAKRPLKINGRLANHGLTYLIKEATGGWCHKDTKCVLGNVDIFMLVVAVNGGPTLSTVK